MLASSRSIMIRTSNVRARFWLWEGGYIFSESGIKFYCWISWVIKIRQMHKILASILLMCSFKNNRNILPFFQTGVIDEMRSAFDTKHFNSSKTLIHSHFLKIRMLSSNFHFHEHKIEVFIQANVMNEIGRDKC